MQRLIRSVDISSSGGLSEATGVRWNDLQLVPPRQVRLHGKGRKERLVPLWRDTADALHRLRSMAMSADQQYVFVNRHGQPLTRDGVAYILQKYASAVALEGRPTLAHKRITPHVLRHSCAVALLQSGTGVTVIRDYLGHASIATTGKYITTANEARCARDVLGACRNRARPGKTLAAEARSSRVPPVTLIEPNLSGVPPAVVSGQYDGVGPPLHIKTDSRLWAQQNARRTDWSTRSLARRLKPS